MTSGGDGVTVGGGHRRDIEGLRAIAVSLVVLYHFGVAGFDGGYVGVDVFFVVSGFLITSSLLSESERKGTFRLRDFYARRIRRLLPISAVVLVATAVASVLILDPSVMRNTGIDVFASGLFSSNWVFAERATDYLQGGVAPSPLQHYWSLSLEEQFYVVWPLLLLAGLAIDKRLRRKLVVPGIITAIVIASLVVSVATTADNPTWAYFGLHTRAWELGIGALVAIAARRLDLSRVRGASLIGLSALSAVIFSAVKYAAPIDFPGWIAALPVVATALLIVVGFRTSNLLSRSLGNRLFHFIGARSYSLYLWHWPVIILAEARSDTSLSGVQKLLALLLTLVLTEVGFRLVENPVRFSPVLLRSTIRSVALGAVAVSLAAGAGLWVANYEKVVTSGFEAENVNTNEGSLEVKIGILKEAVRLATLPRPLPDNLEPSLEDVAKVEFSPGLGSCFVETLDANVPDCEFGDPEGEKSIVLFGDSHMAQWFPVLNEMARSNQFKLRTYVHAGCSLAGITTANFLTKNDEPWCVDWVKAALSDMVERKIDYVVMTNNFFLFDAATRKFISVDKWNEGMRRTVEQIDQIGATPILIGDSPKPIESLLQCLTNNVSDVSHCSSTRSASTRVDFNIAGRQMISEYGGYFLDLPEYMCSQGECPMVVGNTLLYRDWSHLTDAGMSLLAPVVTALLLNFMAGSIN